MELPQCWVFLECPQGKLLRESLEVLGAGLTIQKQHGLPLVALWTGMPPEATHTDYLSSLGVESVIRFDECRPGHPGQDKALLFVLKRLYEQRMPQYFMFGSSPFSLLLAPKLAALLDQGYVARATYLRRIGKTLNLTRPLLQNKLSEILRFDPDDRGLISLFPGAVDRPSDPASSSTEGRLMQESIPVPPSEYDMGCELVHREKEGADNLDLEDAEIVVSGGKGMGNKEGFTLLRELAALLGGTVGASRIAVDLGWETKERLVGQTGRKISPELYIACGISGAHQHRAGMKDSRHILAINTDPGAPIFQAATWGILGDALEVIPEMIKMIKENRTREANLAQ